MDQYGFLIQYRNLLITEISQTPHIGDDLVDLAGQEITGHQIFKGHLVFGILREQHWHLHIMHTDLMVYIYVFASVDVTVSQTTTTLFLFDGSLSLTLTAVTSDYLYDYQNCLKCLSCLSQLSAVTVAKLYKLYTIELPMTAFRGL